MRLNYNFKVGSLFEWRGIPIRIIVLVILIPSLVTYYCSGFSSCLVGNISFYVFLSLSFLLDTAYTWGMAVGYAG